MNIHSNELRSLALKTLFAGALAITGCSGLPRPPWVEKPPHEINAESEWRRYSPQQRIKHLEQLHHPRYPGFDDLRELAVAVGEATCSKIRCRQPVEDLVRAIYIVPFREFLTSYQNESGRNLSDEEIAALRDKRTELVAADGSFLINEDALQGLSKDIEQNIDPSMKAHYQERDFTVTIIKSALLRTIIERNFQPGETLFPSTLDLEIFRNNDMIAFDRLQGFTFVGRRKDGSGVRFLGANSALADLTAKQINAELGPYISPRPIAEAAFLATQLNIGSGMKPEEFLDYMISPTGNHDLLKKWGTIGGKNSIQAARAALFNLSMLAEELISFEEAIDGLRNAFGFTPPPRA